MVSYEFRLFGTGGLLDTKIVHFPDEHVGFGLANDLREWLEHRVLRGGDTITIREIDETND